MGINTDRAGLIFEVSELQDEIRNLVLIGRRFLDPYAPVLLENLAFSLSGVSSRAEGALVDWSIAQSSPVRTNPSVGAYQPDDKGGTIIFAELTFIWQLKPVRKRGDTRPAKLVELGGKASTLIRIFEGTPDQPESAMKRATWRFEVGDLEAPGTHFHVQLGDHTQPDYPETIDIPRLPSVLATPAACLEFVLGELFQDEWPRVAGADKNPNRTWRSIQKKRYERQLDWHRDVLNQTSGSPWVAWKLAKPRGDLFV